MRSDECPYKGVYTSVTVPPEARGKLSAKSSIMSSKCEDRAKEFSIDRPRQIVAF